MRWLQSLRRMQWSWLMMIVIVVLMAAVFAFGMSRNDADRRQAKSQESSQQYILSRKEEELISLRAKLEDVGSKSYIEDHARGDLSYLKPGEIRYTVTNPELLDSYTEDEWQIILYEMHSLDESGEPISDHTAP